MPSIKGLFTSASASQSRKVVGTLLVLGALSGSVSAQVVHQQDFDTSADSDVWTVISPAYSSRTHDPNEDVAGNPLSGAMSMNNSASGVEFASAQFQLCIYPAQPGEAYEVNLAARMPLGQSESGRISLVMSAVTEANCFGSSVGVLGSSGLLTTASNDWTQLSVAADPAPAGTQSIYIRALLVKFEENGSLDGLIDDVLVERVDIFVDGFEGGNTDAWSSSTP